MKSTLIVALALSSGLLLVSAAQAPGSTGPTPHTPAAVPLDGGVSLLAASSVAYGLHYLRQCRKAV